MINRATVTFTQQVEEAFANASKGDYEYRLECKKPISRYAFTHEEPLVKPTTTTTIKKLGVVARARLANARR